MGKRHNCGGGCIYTARVVWKRVGHQKYREVWETTCGVLSKGARQSWVYLDRRRTNVEEGTLQAAGLQGQKVPGYCFYNTRSTKVGTKSIQQCWSYKHV